MDATAYSFNGSSADGDLIFNGMRFNHERGYVALTFFSDALLTTQVTPTAGTATVTVSERGSNFGTISNGTVDATLVGAAVAYPRPNWAGSAKSIKVTFASVADGDFCRIDVIRYGD